MRPTTTASRPKSHTSNRHLHPALDRNVRLFAHLGALVPLAGASGDAAKTRFDASLGAAVVLGRWDLHIAATGATPDGPYPAVYGGRRAALVIGAVDLFLGRVFEPG